MHDDEPGSQAVPADTLSRFRRWAAVAVGLAVLGYLAYALVTGIEETREELVGFRWSLYGPVLGLTLVNYGLRYVKWAWLLRRLDIHVPHGANLWVFAAGLAMAISPGKAGELLKPYLVRVITGAPLSKTIPVLIAERATDAMAVVALAALGVSTFYAEGTRLIVTTIAVMAAGLLVLAIKPLSLTLIDSLRRAPVLRGVADRLEASYLALRACVSPMALLGTFALSLVAWWAECVGYWLIFVGLNVDVSLDAATFLYAFATVFGAPSPGGMGMADAALVEGSRALIPGLGYGEALAGALLVRFATLWFGVLLGAVALFRMENVIHAHRVERTAG